mgnify:CR=1 FL=1
MKKFLQSIATFATQSFETIAIARTRQALNYLPDYELKALGITREVLKTGNFYSVNKVLDFKSGNVNLENKMKDLVKQKAA